MTRTKIVGLVAAGVVVVFLFALPYLGVSNFTISVTSTILIAAILASSVNFLAGQAGMVSLGHAGIAATSSYAVGWASREDLEPWAQLLLALVATLVVSAVYGLLAMRTSGIYLLMVTLAVGMLIYGLAFRFSSITGGENGIPGIERPEWMKPDWVFYYVVVVGFLLATALLWVVGRSPFGASLQGVRDSESRMRSLGYNVASYKLSAFMVSGTVAGFAGLLSVWHTHFVSPSSAGVDRSVLLIVMVILGGIGTIAGPLIGAFIVILVENVLSSYIERWPTALGLIFIVTVLFARAGIAGTGAKVIAAIRRRRAAAESVDASAGPRNDASDTPRTQGKEE